MSPTIKEVIGEEAYKKLCGEFAGKKIYIPKSKEDIEVKLIKQMYIDKMAVIKVQAVVLSELAWRFRRSESWVYQKIKEEK